MLVALSVPDDNIRNPSYIKHLLDIIHRANRNRLPLTLSYARHDQGAEERSGLGWIPSSFKMFLTVCRLIFRIPSFRNSPMIRVKPNPVAFAI